MKTRLNATLTVLGASTLAAASPASAAALLFDFDSDSGASDFEFILESSPAINGSNNQRFRIKDVSISGDISGDFDLLFYRASNLGGFDSSDLSINLFGPQVYSGPTSSPVFQVGNYRLTSGSNGVTGAGSLTVSEVISSVPEPATWLVMLLGFAMVGGAMRSDRQRPRIRVTYS